MTPDFRETDSCVDVDNSVDSVDFRLKNIPKTDIGFKLSTKKPGELQIKYWIGQRLLGRGISPA